MAVGSLAFGVALVVGALALARRRGDARIASVGALLAAPYFIVALIALLILLDRLPRYIAVVALALLIVVAVARSVARRRWEVDSS